MICYRCGREMPDKTPYCKGCGIQLRRRKKTKKAPVGKVLSGNVTIGERTCKAWHFLAGTAAVCVLLVAGLYLVPPLLEMIDLPEAGLEELLPDEGESEQLIDTVTGSIIQCSVPLPGLEVVEEKAYYNGSWQKDCIVNEQTAMRFLRRPAAENWLNTHIFDLYPDVTSVEQFTETIEVSGYPSSRIQFSSNEAPGCVIQTLCVSDGSFDYLYVVEMPLALFDENSIFVDEWFSHLILADAQTGVESFNPAALPEVSSVDVLEVV